MFVLNIKMVKANTGYVIFIQSTNSLYVSLGGGGDIVRVSSLGTFAHVFAKQNANILAWGLPPMHKPCPVFHCEHLCHRHLH